MNSKSQDENGTTRPRLTFVLVMPGGCTYPELEFTFVDLVYFSDNATADG
jgi:hypothetical protein